MVVGAAMLLAGQSAATGAGLGIPKSPSFHSGLELAAAAKDINFQDFKTITNNHNNNNPKILHNSEYSTCDQTGNDPIECGAYWSESNKNPFATRTGDYSANATMPSFTNAMAKVVDCTEFC